MTRTQFNTEHVAGFIRDCIGTRGRVHSGDSVSGGIVFTMYEAFGFDCGLETRYGSFGLILPVEPGVSIRSFPGRDISKNADPQSILESLELVDKYCRLRLPDKYLEAHAEAHGIDFKIALPVIEPDEPPRVDVHYEWTQYPIWLDGRYGIDSIDGHELGLSRELVRDLRAWSDSGDALFNADDPANSTAPANFLEDGFALAKRVRAELPAEWIVTCFNPSARRKVVLTLEQ